MDAEYKGGTTRALVHRQEDMAAQAACSLLTAVKREEESAVPSLGGGDR